MVAGAVLWKDSTRLGRISREGSPVVEYDDVQIRDVEDADLAVFFEYQRDPQATRMAASTARTRGEFFEYWAGIRTGQSVIAQTIVVNGEVAGDIMCWEQWDERIVGYGIGRRYWGRGVATTALGLFLCQVTARPLHAYVAAHNVGSIRVLEKCGFQRVADRDADSHQTALVQHILEF
jgi:RimJ/RimL family protein N-acetyltransferase